MTIRPEELLSAYAAGAALSEDERDRVERAVADDPDLRAELDALRAVIDEARATAPRPPREPAWDQLARAIDDAVSDAAAARPSAWARLIGWWRARPVAAGAAGAALVAACVLLALRFGATDDRGAAPAPIADRETTADESQLDLELPGLDEAWEADSLVYEPEPTEGLEDLFAVGDGPSTSSGQALGDGETLGDGEAVVDFGVAPGIETFLDELSDEELEALEASLSERKPS